MLGIFVFFAVPTRIHRFKSPNTQQIYYKSHTTAHQMYAAKEESTGPQSHTHKAKSARNPFGKLTSQRLSGGLLALLGGVEIRICGNLWLRGWGGGAVGSWLRLVRVVGCGGFGAVGGYSGLGVVVWWLCVVEGSLIGFHVVIVRVLVVWTW